MADAVFFILISLALLLTPGPTNTLLLVGGATNGLKRSLWLAPAELLGYLAAIPILALTVGPFVQQSPVGQALLRLVLALYLGFLAVRLWRTPQSGKSEYMVTPQRVFIVTLLNPKALVFAFVVLPPLAGQWRAMLPHLAALSLMIVIASLCWISFGAALRSEKMFAIKSRTIQRIGSAVLLIFAVVIGLPRSL